MKLNKKGMTLVELIISIALISVILGFLFKILLDVKYETQNAGYAINNQINRAEAINVIQSNIAENGVLGVYQWNNYGAGQFEISYNDWEYGYLETQNNHKTLWYHHSERNALGEEIITSRKWEMKDEGYKYGDFSLEIIDSCYVMLKVEVLNESGEYNPIDDIEILAKYSNCN